MVNALLCGWVQHKNTDAAWGCTFVFSLVVLLTSLILFSTEHNWFAIPSPIFPPATLSPLSWSPPPSTLGLVVAAGLYLLAHIRLWQRERRETAEKFDLFARARGWTAVQDTGTGLYLLPTRPSPLCPAADRALEDTRGYSTFIHAEHRARGRTNWTRWPIRSGRSTGGPGAGDMPEPCRPQIRAGRGLNAARREAATRLQQPGCLGRTALAPGRTGKSVGVVLPVAPRPARRGPVL